MFAPLLTLFVGDHELMQLLVFDAKITQEFFKGKLNFTNEEE